MAGFSTDAHLCVDRVLDVRCVPTSDDLTVAYDLRKCADWIKDNGYSKVCLQFPDELLVDSINIALHIEHRTSQKVYILGDTSYGSCCVDEVAAEHVKADAIIHYGHACLSPVTRLPVLYVFPKATLDTTKFYNGLKALDPEVSSTLILYDVAYQHKSDELRQHIPDELKNSVFVSELDISGSCHRAACSLTCTLLLSGNDSGHSTVKFSRAYCQPEEGFKRVIYIGQTNNPNLQNFLCSLKDVNFTHYTEETSFIHLNTVNVLKQCSYLVERLRDSTNVGLLVGTLGIKGCLEAIAHVKKLCKHGNKKTYVFSVGKPNPAKLANFPEIDVFVAISCMEANFGDRKSYMQPIVGVFEVELAFNENRTWLSSYSRDFRALIPGGSNYIECPQEDISSIVGVSLASNKLQNLATLNSDSTDLNLKPALSVSLTNNEKFSRTWTGLQQSLGDTEVRVAVKGRTGTASGYTDEIELNNTTQM